MSDDVFDIIFDIVKLRFPNTTFEKNYNDKEYEIIVSDIDFYISPEFVEFLNDIAGVLSFDEYMALDFLPKGLE